MFVKFDWFHQHYNKNVDIVLAQIEIIANIFLACPFLNTPSVFRTIYVLNVYYCQLFSLNSGTATNKNLDILCTRYAQNKKIGEPINLKVFGARTPHDLNRIAYV